MAEESIVPGDDLSNLELIGIEPWALKSIPKSLREPFLRDALRFLAKYHHPDKYTEEADKRKHGAYLARLNSVVERLAGDRFLLEEELSEFNTVPSNNVKERARLQSAQSRASLLEGETKMLREQLKNRESDYNRELSQLLEGNLKLQEELEAQRQSYKTLVNKIGATRAELDALRAGEGPVVLQNLTLARRNEFLKSENGPHKKTLKKLNHLRTSLVKKHQYEVNAFGVLPFISQTLTGRIAFQRYAFQAVTNGEYTAARTAVNPLAAIAELFASSASGDPVQCEVQGDRGLKFEEKEWQILGLLPYQLSFEIERNPLLYMNMRRSPHSAEDFERSVLPYTVPFIGTATRGMLLLRAIPREKDFKIQYKTVAVTGYSLQNLVQSDSKVMSDFATLIPKKVKIEAVPEKHKFLPKSNTEVTITGINKVREIDIDRGD